MAAASAALFMGLWLGDEWPWAEVPADFVDPGVGTEVGLPFARLVVDLSALGTAGMLVTAILLPGRGGTLSTPARRSLRSAACLALTWGTATVTFAFFNWSDILGVPVTQLSATQMFHGNALSFPESVEFLYGAALAVIIGIAASVTKNVWGAIVLLLLTGYNLLPLTTTGHAEHSPIIAYALTVHMIALALWIGSLAGLLIHARNVPALLAVAVPRFSMLALACYIAVGASGATMAWVNLGSPDQLWRSRYGLVVLCLVTAQAVLGVFGWWHRRHAVPALTRQRSSHAFIRLAAAEVIIMAATSALGVALSHTTTPSAIVA